MLLLTYAPESSLNVRNLVLAAAIATMARPILAEIGDVISVKYDPIEYIKEKFVKKSNKYNRV